MVLRISFLLTLVLLTISLYGYLTLKIRFSGLGSSYFSLLVSAIVNLSKFTYNSVGENLELCGR